MPGILLASNFKIENIRPVLREGVAGSAPGVIFDISWENAWHNDKNHDAVWVFMKFNSFYNNHVKLKAQGHRILQVRTEDGGSPTIQVAKDGLGFYISPPARFRGKADYKLKILFDTDQQELNGNKVTGTFGVYGIEMVYIPQGPFTLGAPDTSAIKKAAFYRSDANGKSNGLYEIRSEAAIPVAPTADALYYWSEEAAYNGDQAGPIPAAFPKGFNAFYIMKYELNQGQYADFLNGLPDNWTYLRSPIGGRDYYKKRGGIRLVDGRYVADDPYRPMNYVSYTDGLAFTDWAALRPITELEYTKAARGPGQPLPNEFVWGTDNYDQLERYVNKDASLAFAHDQQEGQLTDKNRPIFGASYYWVMDLSGSVWEKVITAGNAIGRSFQGTHGDGVLKNGSATNEDWPTSDHEAGGFGYRGGGYYGFDSIYGDFNPHSPIAHRYYGAWSGGPRYISYGYRAGRTAF